MEKTNKLSFLCPGSSDDTPSSGRVGGCQRSGGSDIGGFHNDACAHLMGVAVRRRRDRVFAVGGCPAASVVADEGGRVSRAGDPEVLLARADKGGHAGERTCGDPEN